MSARTESAPPTTVNAAALPATASATAFVPAAKRDHSNTPIGPFQKIVFAAASRSANAARVSGPMSSPSQPLGRSSTAYTPAFASASNAAAPTTSDGSSTSKSRGFSTRSCSAIFPPMSTASARPPRLRSTPSLSSTLAPPETSTNGRSTSPRSLPRWRSSSSYGNPTVLLASNASFSASYCAWRKFAAIRTRSTRLCLAPGKPSSPTSK